MIDWCLGKCFVSGQMKGFYSTAPPVRHSRPVTWLHGGLLLQGAAGMGGMEGEGVR